MAEDACDTRVLAYTVESDIHPEREDMKGYYSCNAYSFVQRQLLTRYRALHARMSHRTGASKTCLYISDHRK